MENHPAHWSLASAPRGEPPTNHDSSNRSQNVGALAYAPQPDPVRMMAASVPSGSKAGK
jgi:hypothetical protein